MVYAFHERAALRPEKRSRTTDETPAAETTTRTTATTATTTTTTAARTASNKLVESRQNGQCRRRDVFARAAVAVSVSPPLTRPFSLPRDHPPTTPRFAIPTDTHQPPWRGTYRFTRARATRTKAHSCSLARLCPPARPIRVYIELRRDTFDDDSCIESLIRARAFQLISYTRGSQTFFSHDLLKIYSTFEARLL